jgi:hypothetical protein
VDRDLSAGDRADLTAQQRRAGADGWGVYPNLATRLPGRIVPAIGLLTLLSLCIVGLILLWLG